MNSDVSNPAYVVLWHVTISDSHKPTGKTVHYLGNEKLPVPSSLQIAQYFGDDGFYLFYLDQGGEVMTDTYHDDVSSAMEQANFEFLINSSEWEKLGGDQPC